MADKHFQLLVHAGAPSTRQDDRKYTAQAEAYFDLLSSRGNRVGNASRVADEPDLVPSSHDAATTSQQDQIVEPTTNAAIMDAPVYLEDTQLAYTALESQLRSSARSVVTRTPTAARPNTTRNSTTATSSIKRVSGLSQSSYLVSPQLARFNQEQRVQDTEQVQKLPRLVPNTNAIAEHQAVYRADGSDKENSEQTTLKDVESTSELPTSYSLSAGVSAGSDERVRFPPKSASDPGLLATGLPESVAKTASPVRSAASPGPPAGNAREPQVSKASEVQVYFKRPRQSAHLSDSENARLRDLSPEIFPPGPETSVSPFSTHITPALQHLVEIPALATAFKPTSQTRQLEASERGHWLVQCQSWSRVEHIAFWESLEISIENAGWGVWCSRGTDLQLQSAPSSTGAIQEQAFGTVRVWCWGEVVKHVYLLLYVASKSKVRKLGLRWIDSEDRVVVQMRHAQE